MIVRRARSMNRFHRAATLFPASARGGFMKAIRLRAIGGPDELRVEDIEVPEPGEGEVRIRVHTAGMNFTDLGQRDGSIPGVSLPITPGSEAAGVVDAIGSGVIGIAEGARVVAVLPRQGAFAEYAIAPAATVTAIPDELAFVQAVALPVQAPTALLALRAAHLREGESVLVPSAAGGVGTFLVQLAKHLGASRVIGAASSEAKRALASRLGADVTIDPTPADWPDAVREATGGRGVDVVFVSGGGAASARGLDVLAPRGRLVLFGVESMFDTQLDKAQMTRLLAQNQSVSGVATFTLPPDELRGALHEVLALVARGRLEAVVGQTFALADVPAAHRAMAARTTTGKVVIRVRADVT
jgi:NADPH:quinone reductase